MYPRLTLLVKGYSIRPFISSMGYRSRRLSSSITTDSTISSHSIPDEVKQAWDVKSLKIEVTRQSGRALKKIAKSLEGNSSLPDQLDNQKLSELRQRLAIFNDCSERLKVVTSEGDAEFKSILARLLELGIDEHAPLQPVKVKKIKPAPVAPRKPYHAFTSLENIDIWVGRGASDNDLLSCDPTYRHPDEWWMHVAGQAGSHVVIKTTANDFILRYPETIKDAAVLCAHNSKAAGGGSAEVTLTRCRNVSKPKGFVPGMVLLKGEAMRVPINFRREASRLERLKTTKKQ